MSTSWKKYGGISQSNDFNTLNASTIIADKFISRSVRPAYQYYNGTYEVAQDLSAGMNILAGNSTYTAVDAYVNRNIYANNKIFFGGNAFVNTGNTFPQLPLNTTHAYLYGDASNIGVNTLAPKTIFNITGKIPADTEILTVESRNGYIRNIIAQNMNAHGVVVDASDSESNIYFYTDVSTNKLNAPDANIKYSVGKVLSMSTANGITTRSKYFRVDASGGSIYFDGTKYRVDASVNMFFDTSSNIFMHSTQNIQLNADNKYRLDASNGCMQIDDAGLMASTGGTLVLNSSGGLVEVLSKEMNIRTLVNITPPVRGISSESVYNETITVYDNSNSVFLKNVYNSNEIQTGNAITAVAKDGSANTFIRMIAPVNNRGSAIGGGVFPPDTARAMAVFGVSDSSGSYIPSQMIVSSNSRAKYASTLGINTFSPKTEQYVLDVNGSMHVGNGEINTVAEAGFEVKRLSFSKTQPNYGIAVGTPSTATVNNYKQFLLYTENGGKSWAQSDIYAKTTAAEEINNVSFPVVDVYDNNYAFIGGNTQNYAYITNDGGRSWVRLQGMQPILAANLTQINVNELRLYVSEQTTDLSQNIYYTDISINALSTNNTLNIAGKRNPQINPNRPVKSVLTGNYFYLAGDSGVIQYNRSSYTTTQVVSGRNYADIYAYDENNIMAVGSNLISYYRNSTWTHVTNAPNIGVVNLQRVFMYDTQNIVAVGSAGKFIYTSAGPDAAMWKYVPDEILNTSGMKDRLTGAENNLLGLSMPDKNTFIVVDVITTYDNTIPRLGYSKIQYAFLPNLLNRQGNTVLDVSGNMVISGDVYINDAGKLYVDATTVLNQDVSMNSRLFVFGDASFISKVFVKGDVSLNSRLYVQSSTIHQGDVSMNSRLFVQDDVSFNNKLFVQNRIIMPSLSNVSVNIIDGNDDGSGYLTNANHSKNIQVGGNTVLTNIGPVDIALKSQTLETNKKYINIGAINPTGGAETVVIRVGNYTTNLGSSSNMIYIGGGNDQVEIGGNVQFTTTEQMRVNNPLIELNANSNGNLTSAGAGIIIRDNSNSRAGYLLVSDNMQGYTIKAPILGSHPVALETQQLNLNRFTTPMPNLGISNVINSGIMVLTPSPNSDASYSITVQQMDISNILVRDSATSNDQTQKILTNLVVQKDVSLNSRLYVQQDASFGSSMFINQDLTVNGNLKVRQQTVNQYIINTTTTDYTLIIAEDLSLNGRMYIADDVSFNSHLYVNGKTTHQGDVLLNSRLYVLQDASLSSNLYVMGKTTLQGDATLNSNLNVLGKTTHQGDVSLNSRLFVQQDASLSSNLYVMGKTILQGDASLNSRLFVQQDASLSSNLYVMGKTILQGDALLNSRLFVQQDASLSSNLYVMGKTILQGDASLNSRLYVSQDASFNNNLYVLKDIEVNGNLYARKNMNLDGSMNIVGNVSIGNTTTNAKLDVYRDAAPTNVSETTGIVMKAGYTRTAGSPLLETGIRVGDYQYPGSRIDIPLSVYGNGKEMMRITTDANDISNSVYILPKMGLGTNTPNVSIDISYTDAIRIPQGTTAQRPVQNNASEQTYGGYIRYNIDNHQFEGFGPGNAWGSLGGVINVAQNTKILASSPNADSTNNELMFITAPTGNTNANAQVERMRITSDGDVSMNNRLFVHGSANFNGSVNANNGIVATGLVAIQNDISVNGRLYMYNDASFAGGLYANNGIVATGLVAMNNDLSLNGRLYVYSDASFAGGLYANNGMVATGLATMKNDLSLNGRLFTGGDASFNGGLYANNGMVATGLVIMKNDISLNGRFFVGGDASFNSNVCIKSDLSLNSRLSVAGDVSMNGNLYVKTQVLINKTSSSSIYNLDVNGNVQAATYNAVSDYRIKNNVQPLINGTYKVDELNPVSYINKITNRQDIGLIAHEVQEHFPFLVNGEKNGEEHQSVNYVGLIGLLIHEIQQLKARVSELERKNA
jgi:cytoskeletal protein CcmA (bactofilin family)